MRRIAFICFVAVWHAFAFPAAAQPVPSREPSSTHMFPAGGRRGTTINLLIGGECIPPETGFRIWGDGLSAPMLLGPKRLAKIEPSPRRDPRETPISYPKEWESTIEIAADAPLGPAMWRLTCARGGTGTRPFTVGDLPEFIETESNSLPERAERVELPITINGRIAGESDLDYFVFHAAAGVVVIVDVVAARFGSPFDPVVEITDAAGRRIAAEELHVGSDPVLAFRAPADGDYRLLVSNVSFHGSPAHVYRVTLTSVTLADSTTSSLRTELLDRGLVPSISPKSNPESGWLGSSLRAPSLVDQQRLGARRLDPRHPAGGAPNSGPATLELPTTIHGRFATAADQSEFRFRAVAGQSYTIACSAYPAGMPTLPVVAVLDADGKVVAESKSVESPDRECWLDWRSPADGEYRLRLRDVQHGVRGGPEFGYELAVRSAGPDFSLRLASDFVNVVQGARSELSVAIRRSGGFAGPIELAVDGLPDGVRAEPAQIAANQNSGKLVLIANDDARPTDATLRVLGRTREGESTIERVAVGPHLGRDPQGVSVGSPTTERICLTVQHKPVFRLHCLEAYQYAHRGTIYPYAMQVERLDGFDGEITVQVGDRQSRDLDGIEFVETKIPPGVTDFKAPIYFPETMHINAFGQCQTYTQAYAHFTDKWGQRQSTLVVSEKRNIVRTLPLVVKLTAVDKRLVARPGETVICTLQLDRTSNFTGPMDIELVEPPPGSGFAAKPARIEAGQSAIEVPLAIEQGVSRGSPPFLKFRARGQLTGDVIVVSEATIPVQFE